MKLFRKVLLVILLTNSSFSFAQHHGPASGGNSRREAVLMKGIGAQHHAVSTKNKTAQQFFDQGLAFIYAFNHEEAALAFRKAASVVHSWRWLTGESLLRWARTTTFL